METIGKAVVGLVIVLVLGTGFFYALSYSFRDFHGTTLSAAVGAAPTPVAYAEPVFDHTGTIVYYVQQGVEVPYLMYTVNGRDYSKALVFSGESTCPTAVEAPCPNTLAALKAQYGSGPVRVQGTVDAESLLVARMTTAPVAY